MTKVPVNRKLACKVLSVVDQGLSAGLGSPQPGKMCVEAAVCYAMGLPYNDSPPCVGRAVRAFKIGLNDLGWPNSKARARGLRRLAIAQLGSNEISQARFLNKLRDALATNILPNLLRRARAGAELQPKLSAIAKTITSCRKVEAAHDLLTSAAQGTRLPNEVWLIRRAMSRLGSEFWGGLEDRANSLAYAVGSAAHLDPEVLNIAAELCVGVLKELKSPGCKWLGLTK